MKKIFTTGDNKNKMTIKKCCNCKKKFKKGETILARFDNPSLFYHLFENECSGENKKK